SPLEPNRKAIERTPTEDLGFQNTSRYTRLSIAMTG
ncbi:MAG: hypothetical protein ACI9OJ_000585, partial [Myxococcota bacterium]